MSLLHPHRLKALTGARLAAHLQCRDIHDTEHLLHQAMDGGFKAIELSVTTPGWPDLLLRQQTQHPEIIMGIAGLLSEEKVKMAARSGAQFINSATICPELNALAHSQNLVVINQALTPNEVSIAHTHRADIVQLFPVSHFNGKVLFEQLKHIFPDVALGMSGEISMDDLTSYVEMDAQYISLRSIMTIDLKSLPSFDCALSSRDNPAEDEFIISTRSEKTTITQKQLMDFPIRSHIPLHTLVKGRNGTCLALSELFKSLDIPPQSTIEVKSTDDQSRTFLVEKLNTHGYIQFDAKLDQGGPFRLYISEDTEEAPDRCDNLKHVQTFIIHPESTSEHST